MTNAIANRFAVLFSSAAILMALGLGTPAGAAEDGALAMPVQAEAAPEMGTKSGQIVGGVEMSPKENIVTNASKSPDHTKLVAAIKAAGLEGTLSGAGPYIVFAPTNAAFDKLPAGTLDDLMKPENKDKLVKILKYHVVPGRITSHDLIQLGQTGNKIPLRTIQGAMINVTKDATDVFWIEDETGVKTKVSQTDVMQSNGIIFVIDGVLMPK